MRRLACLAVTALLTGGFALAGTPQAWASTITTTLPASVTATGPVDIPFEVTAPGEVCDVSASGYKVVGTGPSYTLKIEQYSLRQPGTSTMTVYVDSCDGDYASFDVQLVVPFVSSVSRFVSPWAQVADYRHLSVHVAGTPADPVTVTVLRNDQPVKAWGPISDEQDLDYKVSRKTASGTWRVVTSAASGYTATVPVEVADHWAPISASLLTYPRCSTVLWSIDRSHAPKGFAGIHRDLKAALAELAAVSGLTFQEATAGQTPTLTYEFKAMGRGGVGGVGGYAWTSSGGYVGTVTLNSQHWWLQRPGFGYTRGTPNRGHLLLHETMHTMGLGHVDARSQVMNPIALPGSPGHLAKGDIAGLKFLYQPQNCR